MLDEIARPATDRRLVQHQPVHEVFDASDAIDPSRLGEAARWRAITAVETLHMAIANAWGSARSIALLARARGIERPMVASRA
ncbi:hypothetical protein [Stakelama saccharophila]|uniref:Uncharacterized protein n=1 Tax=Stakelama saccharophila TaxID=3075605 RepID=A0ABZ0B7C7_9SPHN|nr:hypothetical protein [Stakelama sp. W311]WNO53190.1 hypothetical protein RPR59_12150 [Stakelama sp. W311]